MGEGKEEGREEMYRKRSRGGVGSCGVPWTSPPWGDLNEGRREGEEKRERREKEERKKRERRKERGRREGEGEWNLQSRILQ